MSIKSLAELYRLDDKKLTDYYKNRLSDFRQWHHLPHAEEYMCFPQNMGPHLSIDETSLSNGELYTIITNKAGHGRKGTLVAMLKGTRSEDICNLLLRHLPEGRRRGVRTITLDMAGSMARIARTCFPLAKQIIDRFHVQKEFKEALQDLRVQYRWQVMEDENRKMKEAKKQKLPYQPLILSNGDTLKQLLVRSRYLLFKNPEDWSPSQKQRADLLFKYFHDLKEFYYLSLQLGRIYSTPYEKDVARVKMALWFNQVEKWEYPQFNTIIKTFSNHYERILNFFDERLTNAAAEAFNAKIKQLRATFRGVADTKFFLFRLAKLFA